jgi:hypothetical protein
LHTSHCPAFLPQSVPWLQHHMPNALVPQHTGCSDSQQ